jgi:hypothetical protein
MLQAQNMTDAVHKAKAGVMCSQKSTKIRRCLTFDHMQEGNNDACNA